MLKQLGMRFSINDRCSEFYFWGEVYSTLTPYALIFMEAGQDCHVELALRIWYTLRSAGRS